MAVSPSKSFIRDLVEQSRERVTCARAGQSVDCVRDDTHDVGTRAHGGQPYKSPAKRISLAAVGSHDRDRSVVAAPSETVADPLLPSASNLSSLSPASTTAFHLYRSYAVRKPVQVELLHQNDRRKAIMKSTKQMDKLIAAANSEAAARAAPRTPHSKFKRAIAVVTGNRAFFQASSLPALLPSSVVSGGGGNPHLAFMEFKKSLADAPSSLPPSGGTSFSPANATRMNSTKQEPICFGDRVCLLSLASNLPLAIGPDGRTLAVANSVTGPHMIFTLTDFRDLTRRDEVTRGEDMWLRVEASHLNDAQDAAGALDALVTDSHYYLGGPGWIETAATESSDGHILDHATAKKYTPDNAPQPESPLRLPAARSDILKVVAMKALVPNTEYYGQDRATREFTIERNPGIMRLARWQFSDREGAHGTHDPTAARTPSQLVVNCETVTVLQGADLLLAFDIDHQRAVLRHSATQKPTAPASVAATATSQAGRDESELWQVRLLHRPPRHEDLAVLAMTKAPAASPSKREQHAHSRQQQQQQEREALLWLTYHQHRAAKASLALEQKHSLAEKARLAHERVAQQGDAVLAQIDLQKRQRQRQKQRPVAFRLPSVESRSQLHAKQRSPTKHCSGRPPPSPPPLGSTEAVCLPRI